MTNPTAEESDQEQGVDLEIDDAADPVAQEMQLVGGSASTDADSSLERRRRAAAIGRRKRRVCIVPQCYSSEASNPPVHLHSFPQSPAVSELWKRCVANPKLSTVASKLLCERQYVVCCQHFEDACFEDPTLRGRPEARLRWNAVPTLGLTVGREPHPTGGAPLYAGSAVVATAAAGVAGGGGTAAAADSSCASDSSEFHEGNLVIVKPEGAACELSPTSHVASPPAVAAGAVANGNNPPPPPPPPAGDDNSHEYTLLNRIVHVALGMDQAQAAMLRELCCLKRRQRRQQVVLGHLCRQLAKAVEEAEEGEGEGEGVDETAAGSKRIRLQIDGSSEGEG